MPTHPLHRLTAVVMSAAIATTIGCGADRPAAAASPPASSSASASPLANTISVKAHWDNPPDTFTLTAPCTETDYIPKSGLCHGTGAGKATITGSWQGTTTYEYGFATNPANLTYFTITETFEGTVTGCGTGAMTYRLAGTVDSGGKILDDWIVVEGFGSGDLATATGHGTQLGTYNPDFSQSGDFSGDLACR